MNMDEIVLINENVRPEEPGDVCIYRNRRDACRSLEPVDVAAGDLLAITAAGVRLQMHTDGSAVWMSDDEAAPPDRAFVRKALQHMLRAIHKAGKRSWVLVEDDNERLISAIGFTR